MLDALAIAQAHLYEAEQRARVQAEEANRTKDEFLATVSHELRSPLNAILGWAKLLREGKLSGEAAARALETIERSARSQNRIINDLLDVSRIITGKLRLNVRPIEPAHIVGAAVEAVRPAAEAKAIHLQMVLDQEAGPISGDSDRLQQIVWNLVSNAIKFTPKGGRVQVRLERVNSHIEIIISDTGIGIRPEFLPYVFDRFRQADGSSTRKHSGLGLGLAIVRHLVELHGGTVEAESPGEGRGATFTINLPLRAIRPQARDAEPAGSHRNGPPAFPPALEGIWVVVVDDEADARELVTLVLEQQGARVTPVASAAEALAVLGGSVSGQRPDVLVSDIGMPGQDGYALIRQVRELAPEQGGQIPAVALTAYGRADDRIPVLSAGFQMHVPKPVEPDELVLVISSLTRRAGKGMSA